eukprot:SAG22_NODE_2042_length_3090_cov_9.718823_5_plen_78_part_00
MITAFNQSVSRLVGSQAEGKGSDVGPWDRKERHNYPHLQRPDGHLVRPALLLSRNRTERHCLSWTGRQPKHSRKTVP